MEAAGTDIRLIQPYASDWTSARFGNGNFDTASRERTPVVEGLIRTSQDMLYVTLSGSARHLEVHTACGHRYQGPELAGAVSFIPAGCERRLVLQDVRSRWASISLPPQLAATLWPEGRPAASPGPFTNAHHPFIAAAVAECTRLHRMDGAFDPAYAETISAALVHYLARADGAAPRPASRGRRLSRLQLRVVREYVEAHLDQPISVSSLAATVGLSTGHFFRAFRSATGMTPLAYLQRTRMAQAMVMLERGEASITEVALSVGFSNIGHFSRLFARSTGRLPSAYRQSRAGGDDAG
ncbi:helix-turn-helix domain-containing protein [Sphingomonas sp. DT-207]|uniref:helix-turn-helix domain-containing protein n=1 Tax=Sphingomonas sp. DT-207 TaxID=3396167 RepID=UPI003F1E1429